MISMITRSHRLLPALVLTLTIWRPCPASAQPSRQVQPLYHVQGTGKQGVVGLTPAQIKVAYGFDRISNEGKGQTIAIVVAFDDANIEHDLAVFNKQFDLPACTTANGCFRKIDMSGGKQDSLWSLETALDVEWAHAIAPKAKIVLVEAAAATINSLMAAVDIAVRPPYSASVVSMSWGGLEWPTESAEEDGHFVGANVTFFAAAGDSGHGTLYPAASPYVMSVGATTLHVDQDGNHLDEKAWSGSGGGLSPFEKEPPYQVAYPIPNNPQHLRGIPDVAYVGNPNTGVAVYDSVPFAGSAGWFEVGGTSVGPPQWAALVAIANSMRQPTKPALTGSQGVLYDAAQDYDGNETYNDIVKGRNGSCGKLCKTKPDYDYVTGLGTPQADLLIRALKRLR